MDCQHHTIRLYSPQTNIVYEKLRRDGVCYVKAQYVQRKYQESAAGFLTAYAWFAEEAQKLVPRPPGAEFPYWAFADERGADHGKESHLLVMEVPKDEVILFDQYDWNRVLQLSLLGETREEEIRFHQQLQDCGMNETAVMLSNFYPEQKRLIQESWKRLFRHDAQLKTGNTSGVGCVQAALWQIKKE